MLLSSRSTQRSTFERTGKPSCRHDSEISQLASEMRQGGGFEKCAERGVRTSTLGIQQHSFGNSRFQLSRRKQCQSNEDGTASKKSQSTHWVLCSQSNILSSLCSCVTVNGSCITLCGMISWLRLTIVRSKLPLYESHTGILPPRSTSPLNYLGRST